VQAAAPLFFIFLSSWYSRTRAGRFEEGQNAWHENILSSRERKLHSVPSRILYFVVLFYIQFLFKLIFFVLVIFFLPCFPSRPSLSLSLSLHYFMQCTSLRLNTSPSSTSCSVCIFLYCSSYILLRFTLLPPFYFLYPFHFFTSLIRNISSESKHYVLRSINVFTVFGIINNCRGSVRGIQCRICLYEGTESDTLIIN
jgi:hypothetical protein